MDVNFGVLMVRGLKGGAEIDKFGLLWRDKIMIQAELVILKQKFILIFLYDCFVYISTKTSSYEVLLVPLLN